LILFFLLNKLKDKSPKTEHPIATVIKTKAITHHDTDSPGIAFLLYVHWAPKTDSCKKYSPPKPYAHRIKEEIA
jgi:hypothetical protein